VLIPTIAEPGEITVMSDRLTVRWYWLEQLPQERYSLPKTSTSKSEMFIVPGPLCWKTLSAAPFAPPPVIVITWSASEPSRVAASSPTSSHQTFSIVQLPRQWIPSAPPRSLTSGPR